MDGPLNGFGGDLLIDEICAVLADFSKDGFTSLADEWSEADYLAGQRVNVQLDDAVLSGISNSSGAVAKDEFIEEKPAE